MHFKALMTFKKENAKNSQEAREYVINYLENEGFCSSGYFSNSIADWFVIGGRWSGELQNIDIEKKIKKMLQKKGKPKDEFIYESDIEENKKEIEKIWKDSGGKGECSWIRDNYKVDGYEDDAMIVNKEIYDKFLKEYEGDTSDGEYFWDLDYEEVDKEFIGNKWIVVVDYHS